MTRTHFLLALLLGFSVLVSACAPVVPQQPRAKAPVATASADTSASSATTSSVSSAKNTTWKDNFGSNRSDPSVAYTLLGSGFLQADTSRSMTAIIRKWMKAHPDAVVVPVVEFDRAPNGMRLEWVWLEDGTDNLNQELVRTGACAAGTMAAPPGTEVLVAPERYAAFQRPLAALERSAREKRLGIWE
jgi:hypothetical protein